MAKAQSGVNRFYLVLGGVALLGALVLGWMVWGGTRSVSIPVNAAIEVTDTSGFRGYLLGSDSAPVEITEYADYQCPVCRDFETIQFPTVRRQLIETGLVRWRYRDFPLDALHPHTRVAAHAVACANEQGRFLEMHREIYQQQAEWAASRDAAARFRGYAGTIGLDLGRFNECMSSARYAGRIQASANEGAQLGVPATPTFLIGDRLYPGGLGSDSIRALVQRLLPAAPATRP